MVNAIILCGGKATRLRPVTQTIPKAMVKVNGKPIIDRQITWLKAQGVKDIILACGYKWKSLKQHLGDSVTYSVEDKPLGTAGALRQAFQYVPVNEGAFIINGDNISDVDLKKLQNGTIYPCLALARYRCPYGVYKNGAFTEKPLLNVWVSAGIYYFPPAAVELLVKSRGPSVERDFFAKTYVKVHKHNGYWCTIDTKKDLDDVEAFLSK